MISSVVVDDGEYDNDLIVTDHEPNLADMSEKNVIMVVNRSSSTADSLSESQQATINDEHIYMNVTSSTMAKTSLIGVQNAVTSSAVIRESLGFDIADIANEPCHERIYQNGCDVPAVIEEKFDSDIVELNQQIKHLLNPAQSEHSKSNPPNSKTTFNHKVPSSVSNNDLNKCDIEALKNGEIVKKFFFLIQHFSNYFGI